MEIDEVSGAVVDAAVKLHMRVGPGLLESVYESLLAQQLQRRGFKVVRQQPVSFELDGLSFDRVLRIDMIVDDVVVVELKSVEKLPSVYKKQVLTYLRLMNLQVGLLLNFGAETMKDGLHRIVNGYSPQRLSASAALRDGSSMSEPPRR